MKNVRKCYGKNTNPIKREKSFIRKFFEGSESSESALFGGSSKNVLEKNSIEENKENLTENRESLSLFGSISVKSISPEKVIFNKRRGPKTNTSPVKRNKKNKRKKVLKRKPQKVFPHSTKHYLSLQPRWSDIYRHDLTIEKQGGNKTHSIFSSQYQNCNKIRERHTRPLNSQEKRKTPKKRILSSSDSLDSSDDYIITNVGYKFSEGCIETEVCKEKSSEYIITKVSEHKNFKDVMSESVNACNPEQDLNNASSANIFPELSKQEVASEFQNVCKPEHNLNNAFPSANTISELSKQFEESVKLGDFSAVLPPDMTLYNDENLCTKNLLNFNKSSISFTQFKEIHGTENLNTSDNLDPVLKKLMSDDFSVKTSISHKSNTSKKLNPASFICASHDSISLERASVLKFMTSTPKIPNLISVRHPVNVDSSYDKSCGLGASTSKAFDIIPYPMILKQKSSNFLDKQIEDCSESYPKNITPNKERTVHNSLLSNLICSNKSMTLPDKKSMKSVSSVKNRSLLVSSRDSPPKVKESDESIKIKLLKLCNQDSVAAFADVYDWKNYKIKKIGEGTYGEVYMVKTQSRKTSSVLKVIAVSEGPDDDCPGLTNVLSEVKITKCLSELRNNKRNNAKNFIKMNRVFLVTGIYPPELLVAWDHFSEAKTSYNDRPDNYEESKMFVLLDLEYGGIDMSSCVLRNALEAESVVKQVAASLAVAEEEYIFEHRDLHLGNILIKRNRKKYITYKLRGKDVSFECHGVEATLIDFTLSRLYEGGYVYYNDLAQDISLFEQSGDYQFEVYKDMKNVLGNRWHEGSFYSNILWLKYLCQKFKEFEYSRPSTIAHRKGLKAIDKFSDQLTNCNSAVECLTVCGITPICFERSNTDSELTKKSILISRKSIQKSKLSLCH